MIELRWLHQGSQKKLQYRQKIERYTEHGHWFEWGKWKEADHVLDEEYEKTI